MQSNRKRIRKEFAPLTVAVSVRCTTPSSPPSQVYNAALNEYEPDRALTPCVLLPEVVASAADGSWAEPHSNAALAQMRWYANGRDISTLPEWAGKYEIDQTGGTRGALTVRRNTSPGGPVQLHFEAVLADTRLGVNIPVVTDPVTLSTSEKADDGYSLSADEGELMEYDAAADPLSLREFRLAHGMAEQTGAAQARASREAYLRDLTLTLRHGKDAVAPSGWQAVLHRVDSPASQTRLTPGGTEVAGIRAVSGSTVITMDLRLVERAQYVVRALVGGREVAQVEFCVRRVHPPCDMATTNGTAIHPLDTERYDTVMASCNGAVVDCPGRVWRIVWHTETAALGDVAHNEGASTLMQLSRTGIGSTHSDSAMDVWVEHEHKPAHSFAADSAGNTYTDSGGDRLIFH